MDASRPLLLACIAMAVSGCQLLPGGGDNARDTQVRRVPPTIDRSGNVSPSPVDQQCLAHLSATGAQFSPLPNATDAPGCTRINAVSLSDLQGDAGRLGVSHLGPVTCGTAGTFADWARYGVDRAARAYLGSGIERIETMGSYVCRNVAGSSKRSAHARAEAIDISGFVLKDGRRVSVQGDWNAGTSAEKKFLRVVRQSACKRFGTVLSPDYNAAHADHLHLEFGDSSFCR
tara:strand:+ start:1026 stop:1718 length:693 start_codon:yes stop_codon:yes gene_type:complete